MGMVESQSYTEDLVQGLNSKGCFFISQIIKNGVGVCPRWKDCDELGLDPIWEVKWIQYTASLKSLGLCKMSAGDRMLWEGNDSFNGLKAKEIYLTLIKNKAEANSECWFKVLWKSRVQIKMIIFLWLVWKNRNLTWKNL